MNFEAICNIMLNDIFNNMMYQEQINYNKMKIQNLGYTPRESRNKNHHIINESKTFEKEYISKEKSLNLKVNHEQDSEEPNYVDEQSNNRVHSSFQEPFEERPQSIFDKRKFSNKENIIDQLKKKHNFRPSSSQGKKKVRKSHKFKQRDISKSDHSSPKYSYSRDRSPSNSHNSSTFIQKSPMMKKYSKV